MLTRHDAVEARGFGDARLGSHFLHHARGIEGVWVDAQRNGSRCQGLTHD